MQFKVELNHLNRHFVTLNHNEFIDLIKQYQISHDLYIKEELIMANLKLVLSIVSKYNQSRYSLDDLFQVGIIGLIKAIDYFDINYDVKFSTYAHPLIVGEIKRYIREDRSIKLTRSTHDLTYKILKLKDEYMLVYHDEPSISYLSKKLNISEYEVVYAINSTYNISSLSSNIHNEQSQSIELIDTIESLDNNIEQLKDKLCLDEAIKHLNDKERYIIENRYYLDRTQMEIAEELMVSQAQISRIEKNALKHLRQHL